MNNTRALIVIVVLLFSLAVEAQISEAAQKNYEQFSYAQVIEELEDNKDPSPEALRLLANSAYMMKDLDKAESYFTQLLGHQQPSEDIYTYANVLRMQGKYIESKAQMDRFCELVPEDSRAIAHARNSDYFVSLLEDNGDYVVSNLSVNSSQQELAPSYYQDKVVFASNRKNIKNPDGKWEGNDMPYLDVFVLEGASDEANQMSLFNQKFSKEYNVGPVVFDASGEYMIFTRNSSPKDRKGKVSYLQLFEATKKNKEWGNAVSLSYNSDSYNVGHASLSADGQMMYFVSDMPGGLGGVDIYRSERDESGNWGVAVNLGAPINTEGDEMFPFIHPDGVMTFASNGHQGLGGLDVFSVWVDEPNPVITNLGVPINSQDDDFAMIFNNEMTSGYFTSDRKGGMGSDDLYSFTMTPMRKSTKRFITVLDPSGVAIPYADVAVVDDNGNTIETIKADKNGELFFGDDNVKTIVAYHDGAELGTQSVKNDNSNEPINFKVDVPVAQSNYSSSVNGRNLLVNNPVNQTSAGPLPIAHASSSKEQTSKISEVVQTTSTYTTPAKRYADVASSAKAFQQAMASEDLHAMGLRAGGDLDPVGIYPIHYDISGVMFDDHALAEMQKILDLMQRFPDLQVQAISYTDCRATVTYNEDLSKKRAKAVYNWFAQRLDSPSRIKSIGLGETILVNDCPCGFTDLNNAVCTEEEHKMNRRTEFKILGL